MNIATWNAVPDGRDESEVPRMIAKLSFVGATRASE
jgi:hypothetical protein